MSKMREQENGFTIIEVMIFLAISGLLLLIMLIGTGAMASRQRFTDSTDSLQVFFQAQYDEIVNGVNPRDSTSQCQSEGNVSPGKSSCLLLGKLFTISSDAKTIKADYIISTTALAGSEMNDLSKLKASNLQVVTSGETVYELKWGANISEASRSTEPPSGTGRGPVNSIAFVRVPDTNHIVQIYYKDLTGAPTTGLRVALDDLKSYNPPASSAGKSLVVCIKNDLDFTTHVRSSIEFEQGQGASTITTNYSPGATQCVQ